MATDPNPPPSNVSPQGLPSVKPPSARFILQLFLLPGLIVGGLVLVFLYGGVAWMGSNTPESFLVNLDNPNPDIRWRAASELAQILKRPESLELASNPDFALDIADRLRKANAELNVAEKKAKAELSLVGNPVQPDRDWTAEAKDKQDQAASAAWRKLRPQRDLVLFLISCCGNFTVPVAVPVLSDIALMNDGAEVKGMALRKRRAVWALANLGDNYKRRYLGTDAGEDIKVLSSHQKQSINEKLIAAAAGNNHDERAKMAAYALGVLQKKMPTGVDEVLALCANSDDIFLREVVAMALNFWDGPLVEPTLLKLARDDGKGKRIFVTEAD